MFCDLSLKKVLRSSQAWRLYVSAVICGKWRVVISPARKARWSDHWASEILKGSLEGAGTEGGPV